MFWGGRGGAGRRLPEAAELQRMRAQLWPVWGGLAESLQLWSVTPVTCSPRVGRVSASP
jgi:hypothetical protein